MRLRTFLVLGLSSSAACLIASCSSPPQPAYADISFQTRCSTLAGAPIASCNGATGLERDIYGFNGDMGQHFSCTIGEHAGIRSVNFTVMAEESDGTPTGVTLNANVPAAGGAPSGACQFTWTDGNTYGGNCGPSQPTAAQPCQVSSIMFSTDTATGLPLMDINVACDSAPSIPTQTPARSASVTRAGNAAADGMSPTTLHFYSCPVIAH